jgi:microcystin-dependent protein
MMKSLGKWAIAPALLASCVAVAPPALAEINPYIGDIMTVPWNFCPRNWLPAKGQLLPISQNTALFSVLGTQFGGDGRTNFGLPNLQGRVIVGAGGQGPGLSARFIGEEGGSETTTLLTVNIPSHSHTATLGVVDAAGTSASPAGNRLARTPGNNYNSSPNPANFMALDSASTANAGGGQRVSLMKPYLVMTQCIAIAGVFPPRP